MLLIVIDVAIGVLSLGLFGAAYGLALLATRPARPTPAPATMDLGDEPPAVVNLLGNGWRLNEDAGEATLLELAARRLIELRQPDNDPHRTTVHVTKAEPGALTPYERRVYDRVRGLAVGGAVPVTALTFRNQHEAKVWNRRLHREVVRDARARGLSRRRFGPAVITALTTVALVSSCGVALAVLHAVLRDSDPELGAVAGAGVIAFGLLTGIASRPAGERDTPAGREVAARWLGVRRWLRNHEAFGDLPPAAVAVWDRYLPYGAALGVTHTASAVLDLGMGNRKLVWSSYGGDWRRVRVRYPFLWPRYGQQARWLLLKSLIPLGLGALTLNFLGGMGGSAGTAAVAAGLVLLGYGGYVLVSTLVDVAAPRTITGEVLWREAWRHEQHGKNRRVVWLDHLAVDEGVSDRVKAWGLPTAVASDGCRDGDTVTITVRPWTRRITALTVVRRGRAAHLRQAEPPEPPEPRARRLGRAAAGAGGEGQPV